MEWTTCEPIHRRSVLRHGVKERLSFDLNLDRLVFWAWDRMPPLQTACLFSSERAGCPLLFQ
jgi:hypothetical protein